MKETADKRYQLLFLWLIMMCLPFFVSAQAKNYITGIVLTGDKEAPVPNASVFITNSSKGTVTSATGNFELKDIPAGKYELVISSVGFTTQVFPFSSDKLPLKLRVYLQPKITELEAVVVEPYEKNGWEKWGKFFLENFVGTTDASKLCKLRNPEVVHFRNSKKKNTLTVVADEPLIIENRELGYRLKYNLEEFVYDFENKSLFFLGYPYFEDMATDKSKIPKRFLRGRRYAYDGSIIHFAKSLIADSLLQNGFEVKRLKRIPNLERKRVRDLFRQQAKTNGPRFSRDSSDYYERILKQEEYDQVYTSYNLIKDSLVTVTPDGQNSFFFKDFLYITYKKEKEEREYLKYNNEVRPPYYQRSVVNLGTGVPIMIEENGSFYPVMEFFSSGYWAWSEKISHLLPLDFDYKKGY